PVHYQRFASMLGQHKGWYMIRRTLSPPATPAVIRPGTAHRAEHVATKNPRADILEAANNEPVIDARAAAGFAEHLLERGRGKRPFMQRFATNAQWVLQALPGPRTKAVCRDRKAMYTHLAHHVLPHASSGISGSTSRASCASDSCQ